MLKRYAALGTAIVCALSTAALAQTPVPAVPPAAPLEQPSTTVSGVTVIAPRPAEPDGPPRLELYEGRDFAGGGVIVVQATPNLLTRGFSDHARSARAISGSWQLCNGPDYTPPCTVLTGGQPFLGDVQLSERVSSVRPLGATPPGR